MPETDPGPLSIPKMGLAVTIINGCSMYAILYSPGDCWIFHLHSFMIYITHVIVILLSLQH